MENLHEVSKSKDWNAKIVKRFGSRHTQGPKHNTLDTLGDH